MDWYTGLTKEERKEIGDMGGWKQSTLLAYILMYLVRIYAELVRR